MAANERYSCCYIGILASVSLPAALFMGKEQVPLRHFNAPLTWPAAMSRLNLVPTDTATKNKGNRREQPLSISHPFQSPFPPSLLSPFLLLLLKSTIKNTISNLKHSPCVKLDWKPVLKEITFGAEFLFLQSASGAKEVRKALW